MGEATPSRETQVGAAKSLATDRERKSPQEDQLYRRYRAVPASTEQPLPI